MCQACHNPYIPKTLPGGMLNRTYKTCPHCGSTKTNVVAGQMDTIPKLHRTGPPTSAGYSFNRKKPPTH